jgi:hypothetical protein
VVGKSSPGVTQACDSAFSLKSNPKVPVAKKTSSEDGTHKSHGPIVCNVWCDTQQTLQVGDYPRVSRRRSVERGKAGMS